MKITTIGIDLAKEVFQIHGVGFHETWAKHGDRSRIKNILAFRNKPMPEMPAKAPASTG